jgi:hypothetical protein
MHASATQALRHRRHRKGTLRIAVIADIARHRRHRKGETDGG